MSRKISNIFGLELYRADTIHGRKRIDESCEVCKHFKALLDSSELMGSLTGALIEHIYFEHNAAQKEAIGGGTREHGTLHASCFDCGRGMEEHGWGGWSTEWQCKHCGYEWTLQRGIRFNPVERAKQEAKWRKLRARRNVRRHRDRANHNRSWRRR